MMKMELVTSTQKNVAQNMTH